VQLRDFAAGLIPESYIDDPPQELGAIASGICHELLQRYGRYEAFGARPMFCVLDTRMIPFEKIQEYDLDPNCSYVEAWIPGSDSRPLIHLFRIKLANTISLEIRYENCTAKKFASYDYDNPTSLDRLYDGVKEILDSIFSLIPRGDCS